MANPSREGKLDAEPKQRRCRATDGDRLASEVKPKTCNDQPRCRQDHQQRAEARSTLGLKTRDRAVSRAGGHEHVALSDGDAGDHQANHDLREEHSRLRSTEINRTVTERFRVGAARRILRRYKLNFSESDIPRYGLARRGSPQGLSMNES
jgi:hypothetical protein